MSKVLRLKRGICARINGTLFYREKHKKIFEKIFFSCTLSSFPIMADKFQGRGAYEFNFESFPK